MKPYQETKVVIPESDEDFGKRCQKAAEKKESIPTEKGQDYVSEEQFEKLVVKAKTANPPAAEPEKLFAQTFRRYSAEAPADFSAIITNEAEVVNLFNRAVAIKEAAIMRDLLLDPSFAPVEGAYDLLEALSKESEGRQKMSAEDKALKVLLKLSPEQIAMVMAQLPGAVGTKPEPPVTTQGSQDSHEHGEDEDCDQDMVERRDSGV